MHTIMDTRKVCFKYERNETAYVNDARPREDQDKISRVARSLLERVRLVITVQRARAALGDTNLASSSFSLSTIFVHVVGR